MAGRNRRATANGTDKRIIIAHIALTSHSQGAGTKRREREAAEGSGGDEETESDPAVERRRHNLVSRGAAQVAV